MQVFKHLLRFLITSTAKMKSEQLNTNLFSGKKVSFNWNVLTDRCLTGTANINFKIYYVLTTYDFLWYMLE